MKKIVGGDNITLHINLHAALVRTMVLHRTLDCWKRRIAQDVSDATRISICTASKRVGEEIEHEILRPSKCAYKFYHSESSDSLKEDFLRLNEAWHADNARVTMYTPTVTVGASFDVPDCIERVYVYGTPKSVTPRVVIQWLRVCAARSTSTCTATLTPRDSSAHQRPHQARFCKSKNSSHSTRASFRASKANFNWKASSNSTT
jgi:hypothetical protein